ncbi:hypothetical protein GCM10022224_052380 [Nonomuraea antimicrobica]|uniref:DUF885 domain-containing protein n=1 Tax=Nonomuraea antimicrobica TaxID=561173 RepID=A0ABP7C6R1_9ACTN
MSSWQAERARVRELATRFWAWRAVHQPRTRDDIPRIERPGGWLPDWTADAVRRMRSELAVMESHLAGLTAELTARLSAGPAAGPSTGLSAGPAARAVQVDLRLLGSALARARWELDLLRLWRRHPGFYVDQSLGPLFDLLLVPADFDRPRCAALLRFLEAVPATLATGLDNVGAHAVPAFTRLAVDELADIGDRVRAVAGELAGALPGTLTGRLRGAAGTAGRALEDYRRALSRLPSGDRPATVGGQAFGFFLSRVALLPYTPEEMIALGRREYERACAREAAEETRCRAAPVLPRSAREQVRAQHEAELRVRRFYEEHDLLTQPAWLPHYRTAPLPGYLAPLAWLGINDDLTSPSRQAEHATSYVPEPAPDLPFFHYANAVDPLLGIIHEGAHHQQLALSWARADPVRRHYYDSAPNEGIAFYNEELMLNHGLLDGSPHARRIACTFMRLRALRVEVDVGLAVGGLGLDEAADRLARGASVDAATAAQEAASFAAAPGQGLSYQIGKAQIERLIADARPAEGFRLRDLHDYLWRNGNVPIALLRWEYLGLRDELDRATAAAR